MALTLQLRFRSVWVFSRELWESTPRISSMRKNGGESAPRSLVAVAVNGDQLVQRQVAA